MEKSCDSISLESSHPIFVSGKPTYVNFIHTYECKDNKIAYFKVDFNMIPSFPYAILGQG